MSRFLKYALVVTLIGAVILIVMRHKNERFTANTQARYAELISEVKPFLARKNRPDIKNITAASALLDQENSSQTKPVLETFLTALNGFDKRFAEIAPSALGYCERDEFYRYWGAVHHWEYWTDRQGIAKQVPIKATESPQPPLSTDQRMRLYESRALSYMGQPQSFSQIKARGEAEFETVSAELGKLAAMVNAKFGQSLDEFAANPQHLSRTDAELTPRLEATLRRIETAFKDDFSFAPVPAAVIETRPDYGPWFAIASYNRRRNAMVVYWQTGIYTHVYDTMLAVHEIMPGHHQQLAMEREPVCSRGPISTPTAFLEGWASYAEILAEEKGLFAAPDQRLGWLDYRLIRAMRIVMDTARIEGALTEAEAMALWESSMPRRLHALYPREWARINRGPHHLSYILGADAIITAKAHVKAELKEGFNEAEFHQALLSSMHRSLEYLGPRMSAQILERRAEAKRAETAPPPVQITSP